MRKIKIKNHLPMNFVQLLVQYAFLKLLDPYSTENLNPSAQNFDFLAFNYLSRAQLFMLFFIELNFREIIILKLILILFASLP